MVFRSVYEELETEKLRISYQKDFFSMVTHELRNPLHGILGIMEILNDEEMPLGFKESIRLGYGTSQLMMSLVNDILDLSQIEAGKFKLAMVKFSPIDVINECIGIMKFQYDKKKLKLNSSFKEGIPEIITNDKNRYRQIVLNLLGNSLKFTSKGHVDIKISYEGDKLVTQVIDTGIGIKKDENSKLFSVYGKMESNMDMNPSGVGLGLSICKKLCEVMGGVINAISNVGEGSTFTFKINNNTVHSLDTDLDDLNIDTEEFNSVERNELILQRKPRGNLIPKPMNDFKGDRSLYSKENRVLIVDDDFACSFVMSKFCQVQNLICDTVYINYFLGIIRKRCNKQS